VDIKGTVNADAILLSVWARSSAVLQLPFGGKNSRFAPDQPTLVHVINR
jgi:hypothetical protein